MKKIFILFFVIFSIQSFAQKKVYRLVMEKQASKSILNTYSSLFNREKATNSIKANTFSRENAAVELSINTNSLSKIMTDNPSFMRLNVPTVNGKTFDLLLIPINIFSSNYKVLNSKGEEIIQPKGLYYQGIVNGDPESIVSFSFTNNEITGIISNDKGNFVIGKIKDSAKYTLYNDKDLVEKQKFECGVNTNLETKVTEEVDNSKARMGLNVGCRKVQIYLEADNAIYTAQGSNIITATNFSNALFAQVAVLYNNEDIEIELSALKIWDTTDPYVSTTTTEDMLDSFDDMVGTTFTGDIAHLISGRYIGGGYAWIDVLCNKGTGISANMRSNFFNVPIYSYNVFLVAHELGHNFGSRHTQSCSWPGGPIDNCASVEDGTCPPGPTPIGGGTIMSYCEQTSNGVNFNNGFGLLPGNLIRSRTQSCFGSSILPSNLQVLESYSTEVTLAWEGVASQFTLEYKKPSETIWTSINTNKKTYHTLKSLTANTTYEWRVKGNCSAYATSTFSTTNIPPISYCDVKFTIGCITYNIGIKDFIINSTNWNPGSGCSSGGYDFIYSPIRNLEIGSTNTITINPLRSDAIVTTAAIWIDLNKNGTFESSEKLFTYTNPTSIPIVGNFTIPSTTPSQTKTRMRVILSYSTTPTDPCKTYTYGEAEDYLINLNPSCSNSLVLVHPTDDITTGNFTRIVSATSGSITAENRITGTGTRVLYEGKKIELLPGFIADTGTVVEFKTGGCL